MIIKSVADISGDGSAHTLTSYIGASVQLRWIQISPVSASGTARLGDSDITTSRGIPIPHDGSMFCPFNTDTYDPYISDQIYILFPNGETWSIGYAI